MNTTLYLGINHDFGAWCNGCKASIPYQAHLYGLETTTEADPVHPEAERPEGARYTRTLIDGTPVEAICGDCAGYPLGPVGRENLLGTPEAREKAWRAKAWAEHRCEDDCPACRQWPQSEREAFFALPEAERYRRWAAWVDGQSPPVVAAINRQIERLVYPCPYPNVGKGIAWCGPCGGEVYYKCQPCGVDRCPRVKGHH